LVVVNVASTVAPHYAENEGAKAQLRACVSSVMSLALDQGLRTVAVCGLGAGVFGWPAGTPSALP
jgi:O-acetyl-ADP-ribose deacetylase (regulator of RNase III)